MKNILPVITLFVVSFLMLHTQGVKAECVIQTGANQQGLASANWQNSVKYGAFVNALSKTTSTNCEHYLTQVDTQTGHLMSGELSQIGKTKSDHKVIYKTFEIPIKAQYNSIATVSDFSVSSFASEYFSSAASVSGKTSAQVVDLVLVHNPNAQALEETKIPFEYCSELSSGINGGGITGTNQTALGYGDFNYLNEADSAAEAIVFDNNAIAKIIHAGTGKICRTGHLRMKGQYLYFSLGLKAFTIGNADVDPRKLSDGTVLNVPIRDGTIEASFSWTLPAELECQSASGKFQGCAQVELELEVTQAVFQEKKPVQLVHERTTAVIVYKEPTEKIEFSISENGSEIFKTDETFFDIGEKPNQFIFYCNESVGYCNLKDGGYYEFKITNLNDIKIERVTSAKVEKTDTLDIFFIELISPFCVSSDFCGMSNRQTAIEKVIEDNTFFRKVFPIKDKGLGLAVDPSIVGNSYKTSAIAFGTNIMGPIQEYKICGGKKSISLDREALQRDAELIAGRADRFPIMNSSIVRPFGYVSNEYFNTFTSSRTITGVSIPVGTGSEAIQLVTIGSRPNNSAHELGHSLGLPVAPNSLGVYEEYELDNNCERTIVGKPAEGFDVYADISQNEQAHYEDAYNYMGASGATDKPYWVNFESWEKTIKSLQQGGKDPSILFMNLTIDKSGLIKLRAWRDFDAFPSNFGEGSYKILALDQSANLLNEYSISPEFSMHLEGFGKIETDSAIISIRVPYENEVANIRLINAKGKTLLDIDPMYKVFSDTISGVSKECSSDVEEQSKIADLIQRFEEAVKQRNADEAIQIVLSEAEPFLHLYKDQCAYMSDLFGERLLDHMTRTVNRIEARFIINTELNGDLDNDGDVDRNDLSLLMSARNQVANGSDDPRDVDNDGKITGLDARKLTLLCTRSRCAVE